MGMLAKSTVAPLWLSSPDHTTSMVQLPESAPAVTVPLAGSTVQEAESDLTL